MPIFLAQSAHKRSSGSGKGNRKSDPRASLSQYNFLWLWKCCACNREAEMNRWACESCQHPRCENCTEEFVVVPRRKGSWARGLGKVNVEGDGEVILEEDADAMIDIIDEFTFLSEIDDEIPTLELAVDEHESMSSRPSLIPLCSKNEDDLIFVPREVEDSELLNCWHDVVLVAIFSSPNDFEDLTSVHLVRQGPSEPESRPTILVSTKAGDHVVNGVMQEKISELFPEPMRPTLRISFEKSTLRRTVGGSLPPICKPRNTGYQQQPFCGASIGIKHKADHTATLGGYLITDGTPHILTVDHLLPTDLSGEDSFEITHPSEQESHWSRPWAEVKSQLEKMETCCKLCVGLWNEHHDLENYYKPLGTLGSGTCRTALEFSDVKSKLVEEYPCNTLGGVVSRSGTRSRLSDDEQGRHQVEMDWALVSIDKWPISLDAHIKQICKSLELSTIKPGSHIKATGRTSGLQTGQINTARSLIRHVSRITQEWTVIRDPQAPLHEWIKGGIGVDGDSGAWIIDRDSGALYGMAWGRDRVFTDPICIFSPILDVIKDIKERMGAKTVTLPVHEIHAKGKGKVKGNKMVLIPNSLITPHHPDNINTSAPSNATAQVLVSGNSVH